MTVKELKQCLEQFNDENDVIVALFKNSKAAEIFDTSDICLNGTAAQLNIHQIDYIRTERGK